MSTRPNALHMYRSLMRYVKDYPSIKRGQIEQEIYESFREHRQVKEGKELDVLLEEGQAALGQFQRFRKLGDENWVVSYASEQK